MDNAVLSYDGPDGHKFVYNQVELFSPWEDGPGTYRFNIERQASVLPAGGWVGTFGVDLRIPQRTS